jgi:hypothetical protein
MKNTKTRKSGSGGARKGAGRPSEVGEKLVALQVAINGGEPVMRREGISLRHAYRLLQKHSAASLIGAKRVADLRELGESEDAAVYVKIQETVYLGKRYDLGFAS